MDVLVARQVFEQAVKVVTLAAVRARVYLCKLSLPSLPQHRPGFFFSAHVRVNIAKLRPNYCGQDRPGWIPAAACISAWHPPTPHCLTEFDFRSVHLSS